MSYSKDDLPALEQQLGQMSTGIYDSLLDLNVPAPQLMKSFQDALTHRDAILGVYGVKVAPRSAGVTAPTGGGGGWGGAAAGGGDDGDFKSKLCGCVGKSKKITLGKNTFTYETQDAEGGYVATVASEHLADTYMGEVAASKRQAEHMAAKAAIAAEFPQELNKMNIQAAPAPQKGQKRGAPPQANNDLKSKLMYAMQVLKGQPLNKADLTYETKAVDPDAKIHEATYVSTLTLSCYEGRVYEGEACGSKKEAENQVANKAIEDLSEVIEAAKGEHQAKKQKLKEEKLDKLKASTAAKKEAKKAAEGGEAAVAEEVVEEAAAE